MAFHPVDLAIMAGMYVVCAFGITVGFHRYFTHRSFETVAPRQGDARDPRLHDDAGAADPVGDRSPQAPRALGPQGDPHSPHAGHGEGVLATAKGFVHAHVGWMFTNLGMEQGRIYGRDLYEDRLIRTIDRLYLLWVGAHARDPVRHRLRDRRLAGAIEGLIWGGLVRIFLYQHATFSVNSICHMFGRRDYRSRDESRNNWLVAVLVFGEGWHNNHHAFPASARHGLHRFQLDLSWWLIRGLEKLRLVWNVRLPSEAQMERRRIQPANGRASRHEPRPGPRRAAAARASRPANAGPRRAPRRGSACTCPARRAPALARSPRLESAGETPGIPGSQRSSDPCSTSRRLPAQGRDVEPVGDPRRQPEHARSRADRRPLRSRRHRPSRTRAA